MGKAGLFSVSATRLIRPDRLALLSQYLSINIQRLPCAFLPSVMPSANHSELNFLVTQRFVGKQIAHGIADAVDIIWVD